MRPLIGITAYAEEIKWGVWADEAALVPLNYVRAVEKAGGRALIVPPSEDGLEETLGALDALIFSGGGDLDPDLYGAEPHPETDEPRRERDDFELALARRALERDIPLLGICRGMQVMNVARGGTLVQHVEHEQHRRSLGTFDGNDHPVRLEQGSLAARAAGETAHGTLSHHHQGIDRVGDGFVVTGWADEDELPEAFEDPELRFALGVQWHPEADEESPISAAFVAEAGRRG